MTPKAGACLVGTNCYYDPETTLETLALMKEGLAKAGLLDKPTYLMAQPLGFNCPDAANTKYGYSMFFKVNDRIFYIPQIFNKTTDIFNERLLQVDAYAHR